MEPTRIQGESVQPQKISSLIILFFAFLVTLSARASEDIDSHALSFKAWKEQQVLMAQNKLLRISAELEVIKPSTEPKKDSPEKESLKEKAAQRFYRAQGKSQVDRLKTELKLAKNSVETATELTFDDYIAVYLPTLTHTPEAIDTLVESMSREEISKILKEVLKKQSDQRDKKANSPSKLNGFWVGQADSN